MASLEPLIIRHSVLRTQGERNYEILCGAHEHEVINLESESTPSNTSSEEQEKTYLEPVKRKSCNVVICSESSSGIVPITIVNPSKKFIPRVTPIQLLYK